MRKTMRSSVDKRLGNPLDALQPVSFLFCLRSGKHYAIASVAGRSGACLAFRIEPLPGGGETIP